MPRQARTPIYYYMDHTKKKIPIFNNAELIQAIISNKDKSDPALIPGSLMYTQGEEKKFNDNVSNFFSGQPDLKLLPTDPPLGLTLGDFMQDDAWETEDIAQIMKHLGKLTTTYSKDLVTQIEQLQQGLKEAFKKVRSDLTQLEQIGLKVRSDLTQGLIEAFQKVRSDLTQIEQLEKDLKEAVLKVLAPPQQRAKLLSELSKKDTQIKQLQQGLEEAGKTEDKLIKQIEQLQQDLEEADQTEETNLIYRGGSKRRRRRKTKKSKKKRRTKRKIR